MVLLLLSGCKRNAKAQSRTHFALNTVITITLYEEDCDALFEECMHRIDDYEALFSRTKEGSDIYRINHANGAPVTVDSATAELLTLALSYAERSGGIVDPTIGTLSQLWNIGDTNEGIVPSDAEIEEALSHVDYTKISVDGTIVQLSDPEAKLDLGFIAKGYIADRLKEYLQSEGVASGIINLGGNVLTIGSKPDGSNYRVGIQKPFAESGTAIETLSLSDSSLVSSGNYERYFEKDGVIYHHILSTENGYPADSGLSSVTIISQKSVDGDALSTLCFLLGYEDGRKLIDSLDDTEAVFIDESGNILP